MTSHDNEQYPIYPAYTFNASRTYFAWVKITAADIHNLRSVRGFEGQNLFFHLNHPIRFVCVTGPIISIEDIASKYALLTLDDGSGATIVVKITRLDAETANSPECPSNTTVENVNVRVGLGVFDVLVDDVLLEVGTVVKVKCSVDQWKGMKQLELKKITIVKCTAEEIIEWKDVAKWKREILDTPWVLGAQELSKMEQKDRDDRQRQTERQRRAEEKKRAYLMKKAEREQKMKMYEEKWERRRRKEEIMMNAGALI